LYLVARCNYSL